MKALKWVLIVGGGVVALVIAALLIIPLFVDVETYKPEIEKQVASAVGRPFAIKGPLKLSLFPWAGVAFSDLHLGSPPGYKEQDLLVVKSFDVRMKLLPLLFKDVQVQRFVIEGPRIALEKNKAGRGNWEGWGGPPQKDAPKTGAPPASKGPMDGLPLKSLVVGEFAVRAIHLAVDVPRVDEAQFVWVGGRPEDVNHWKKRVKSENVVFTGFIPNRELPLYQAAADVLLMPYRPHILGSGKRNEKKYRYRLAGPSCLAGDVIGDYSFDRPLRRGDKLIFTDMALYSIVKNTTFNGINLPDIAVIRVNGRIEVVRKFGYQDYRDRQS